MSRVKVQVVVAVRRFFVQVHPQVIAVEVQLAIQEGYLSLRYFGREFDAVVAVV